MPDWRTLEPGPELDAIAAERVFGATIHEGGFGLYWTLPGERPVSDQRPLPHLSTNDGAALELLDLLGGPVTLKRLMVNGRDEWQVTIAGWTMWAPTLPHAICRAALACTEITEVANA